jgi:hypothetical protein
MSDGVGQLPLRVEKDVEATERTCHYTRPRERFFRFEGTIPEGGIAQLSSTGKRVMDMFLDGVVIVPRPDYRIP